MNNKSRSIEKRINKHTIFAGVFCHNFDKKVKIEYGIDVRLNKLIEMQTSSNKAIEAVIKRIDFLFIRKKIVCKQMALVVMKVLFALIMIIMKRLCH